MAEKTFKVKTKFIFEGEFEIVAENAAQAKEMVEKHCGLVIGGDIHTTLDDETCKTWNFGVHPEKKIVSAKKA